MNEAYSAHVLDNGLTVLMQENHSAPIISHQVWYRVGSRNEVPGKTGSSHFVEHMLFKGTKRFPEAVREISRCGGFWNAFTFQDATAYHVTMPADRIGTAIEIEADRMVNSLFDPKETESERTVILSEKEGEESEPTIRQTASILKAAFPGHPYGRQVIGEGDDLQRLTRDELYEYYRTWYTPNNAVVTLAGDFDSDEMLRRIESAYGSIPARSLPSVDIAPEKPIRSPLSISENGSAILTDIKFYWRIPGGKDPDIFAVMLLESILAGPPVMEMNEQGSLSVNRTSRLYRKLVDGGMAADIGGCFSLMIDPYVVNLGALVSPDVRTEDVLGSVMEEIESIARLGVMPAELEKARKQIRAVFTYAAEDVATQAFWLGYSSIFDQPAWYTGFLQRLQNVRPEDISRVAGSIFRRDNCITAVFSAEEKQQ